MKMMESVLLSPNGAYHKELLKKSINNDLVTFGSISSSTKSDNHFIAIADSFLEQSNFNRHSNSEKYSLFINNIDEDSVSSSIQTLKHTVKCNYCSNWFINFSCMAKHSMEEHAQSTAGVPALSVGSKIKNISGGNQDKPKRSWACPVCWREFAKLANLRIHSRTHTGEKPYSCRQCDRSFSQLSTLRTHQRMHAGDRKHRCNLCMKEFLTSSNLRSHLRTHTGERPFGCSVCGKTFSDYSGMKRHEKTHSKQSNMNALQLPSQTTTNIESINLLSTDISKALEELPALLPQNQLTTNSMVFANQNIMLSGLPNNAAGIVIQAAQIPPTEAQVKPEVECHLPAEVTMNSVEKQAVDNKVPKIEPQINNLNETILVSPAIMNAANPNVYQAANAITAIQQNSFDSAISGIQEFIVDPITGKLAPSVSMANMLPQMVQPIRNGQTIQLNATTGTFNLNGALLSPGVAFAQPSVAVQQPINAAAVQSFGTQLPLLPATIVSGPGHAMACSVNPHQLNTFRSTPQPSAVVTSVTLGLTGVPQPLPSQAQTAAPQQISFSRQQTTLISAAGSVVPCRSQVILSEDKTLLTAHQFQHAPLEAATANPVDASPASRNPTMSQIVFPDQMRTDN